MSDFYYLRGGYRERIEMCLPRKYMYILFPVEHEKKNPHHVLKTVRYTKNWLQNLRKKSWLILRSRIGKTLGDKLGSTGKY